MKRFKRMIFSAVAAAMLINLTACGGEDGSVSPEPTARKEYVWKSSNAEITEDIKGDFDRFVTGGDRVYFLSEFSPDEESAYSEYYLNFSDTSGGGFSSVQLYSGEGHLSPIAFDNEGSGFYIETRKEENERFYILRRTDGNGKETFSADITAAVSEAAPDIYPSKLRIIGENIFVGDYDSMLVLAKDGSLVSSVTDISGLMDIICAKNNVPYACLWCGSGYELRPIDTALGTLGDKAAVTFDSYGLIFADGRDSGYDFFASNGSSLSGYDINGDKTELFDWISAGVGIIEVTDIFYAGDETFICAGKSHPYKYPKIFTVKKQLCEITDKKELVLAGSEYSINGSLENNIVKFNAANENCKITVKKYPYDNISQLSLDIISGKVPDILISNADIPTDNFISKGIFADLYDFIDSDGEINRSDFVPSLLASCETEGKLYRFTDCFKIYTVIGKTSIFGGDMGITPGRLRETAAGFPEGTEVLPASTKEDVLRFAMEISGNAFVDPKKGACSFDTEEFVNILEFAGGFISSEDFDTYFNDSFWDRFETMYRDGSALLMIVNLSDYTDIYRFEKANFGERVTAVGFPCGSGNGTSFIVDSGFSISAASPCKEEAWEFVRTLLTPEYQDACGCFPVRNDSLEKAAAAAMKHDPNRENYALVLMGQMMLSAGVENIGEPSREDIERVNDIIANTRGIMTCDENIMEIILDEANAYFGGIRTAEEAAQLIQGRVRIYLDEQS